MAHTTQTHTLLAAGLLSLLAACAAPPAQPPEVIGTVPAQGAPVVYAEYGRVTQIERVRSEAPASSGVAGAVIGGVVGGAVGNQIGKGGGRDVATAAGVIGGAVLGNQIEKNSSRTVQDSYRVTVRTDRNELRVYSLGGVGDLRIGDRVRLEGGQLYRV